MNDNDGLTDDQRESLVRFLERLTPEKQKVFFDFLDEFEIGKGAVKWIARIGGIVIAIMAFFASWLTIDQSWFHGKH